LQEILKEEADLLGVPISKVLLNPVPRMVKKKVRRRSK